MDLLESSHQPDMFIRSRKKDSCPRPNAVDGSLIYKGNADLPMKNQQSDSSTRFPHGTEVRFDCLRTALDEEVILDEEGDYLETEENVEENVDDGYLEDENYDEYPDAVDNDQDVYNFRKKRAIRAKTNKRKKSRKNSNRRRNKNRSGDNEDGTDGEEETDSYGNQIRKEDAIEDMIKKEKYRSWKIVCNDGKWIGKSLGCDENGNPLGFNTTVTASEAGMGSLTITLVHEGPKPNNGLEEALTTGVSDIQKTFEFTVTE